MTMHLPRKSAVLCAQCQQTVWRSVLSVFDGSQALPASIPRSFGSRSSTSRKMCRPAPHISQRSYHQVATARLCALKSRQDMSSSRTFSTTWARNATEEELQPEVVTAEVEHHPTKSDDHTSAIDGIAALEAASSSASRSRGTSIPKADNDTAATEYVPWYLQHKSDIQPSPPQHRAGGQDLPEMPDHAPALLEPLTIHILNTLGLTFINILDLRGLTDPPPALGANLFMLVATARSERHLHASADKLCRWLRTEHRLSPYADGLLGRNEMKIAVRRRVRKAKMMSAVGVKAEDDGRDIAEGLRSGWICVNVGRVDGGVLPETILAESQRQIVGFGTSTTTSNIVVQMLTEEKREEVDLEGLWNEALRRRLKKHSSLASAAGGDGQNLLNGPASSNDFTHGGGATAYQPAF